MVGNRKGKESERDKGRIGDGGGIGIGKGIYTPASAPHTLLPLPSLAPKGAQRDEREVMEVGEG